MCTPNSRRSLLSWGLDMAGHALLSPSSSERWINCPASVMLSLGIEEATSEYAEEGTCAHRMAELLLDGHTEAERIELEDIKAKYPDMQEAVFPYVDYVSTLVKNADYYALEMRVDISSITGEEGAGGTVDCVVVKNGELHIVDLKYGMGVAVSAEHNSQLSLYALATLEALDMMGFEIEKVFLTICQPRLGHLDTWEFSSKNEQELYKKKAEASAQKALAIVNGQEPQEQDFGASEKACRWCKAKATCPRLTESLCEFLDLDAQEGAQVVDAIPSQATPDVLGTPEGLAKALTFVPLARAWCDAVEQRALAEAMQGTKLPGFKLVEGRKGLRKWTDEAEVDRKLNRMGVKQEARYDIKLISPAKAEKLIKQGLITERQWGNLVEFITQADGKPQLVEASDKRPAIEVMSTAEGFLTYDD